jgi:2-phosphosulfolactate phosphatase
MRAQRGTRIVLPSPNGSRIAFQAASLGAAVFVACLRNAAAVASAASSLGGRVLVVPAGERWPDGSLRPCVEDLIGAGAVIDALPGELSPEAAAAAAVYRDAKDDLLDRLMECASGRELVECGFAHDVEIAAQLNSSRGVPILRDEAFVDADAQPLNRERPVAV